MNSKLIVWKKLDENKYGYLYIKDSSTVVQ